MFVLFLQERKARRKSPLDSSAEGDSESGTGGVEEEGEGDGEAELSASEKARQEFLKNKLARDAALLDCAKSFAMARVPVLTVRSELCEGTLLATIRSFLKRFLNYRKSLLLSPQCISLPKASHTGFICVACSVSPYWPGWGSSDAPTLPKMVYPFLSLLCSLCCVLSLWL